MSDCILTAENIHKTYITGSDKLDVLRGLNLEVRDGEILAIVGPSGVGKSTLLHILGAIDRPTQGKVFFNKTDIFSFSDRELAILRNKMVGFIFQFYHLLPEFTALENVMIPGRIAGRNWIDLKKDAMQLLAKVDVMNRANHKPSELSGGEQQRVAVARALINNPQVVLADEPSGNLDRKTADELHELISELNKKLQKTFIIVTHNERLSSKAHRIITIEDGKAKPITLDKIDFLTTKKL